jgi:hypothetical protein
MFAFKLLVRDNARPGPKRDSAGVSEIDLRVLSILVPRIRKTWGRY